MKDRRKEIKEKDVKVINFMRWCKPASNFSLLLVILSFVSLAVNGLNFGLDFTGGTQVEARFETTADLDLVNEVLAEAGFENYEAVHFSNDSEVLIRIQDSGGEDVDPEVAAQTGDRVVAMLSERTGENIELQRSEYVGSVVGEELKEQGILGMLVSLAMMLAYIAFRFQYKFGLATLGALAEDVIITLGLFSVLQLDFDLTVLAAVLAVIGYGLNDTIVICDRIRENFRIMRKTDPEVVINLSITQTLGRTIVTSLTTIMVLFILLVLGGDVLRGFSLALFSGIVVGTYSTTFVAPKILLSLNVTKEDLMAPVNRKDELDAIP